MFDFYGLYLQIDTAVSFNFILKTGWCVIMVQLTFIMTYHNNSHATGYGRYVVLYERFHLTFDPMWPFDPM